MDMLYKTDDLDVLMPGFLRSKREPKLADYGGKGARDGDTVVQAEYTWRPAQQAGTPPMVRETTRIRRGEKARPHGRGKKAE